MACNREGVVWLNRVVGVRDETTGTSLKNYKDGNNRIANGQSGRQQK
jgi:hypothetical protein